MSRIAAALLVAVAGLLVSPAPAAAEERVPPVLRSWSPASARPAVWSGGTESPVPAIDLGPDNTCPGTARGFTDDVRERLVSLVWYACPESKMRDWTARLDDVRSEAPIEWRATTAAVKEDHEVVTPAGDRGHHRYWVQGRMVLRLTTVCVDESRATCLAISRDLVRDLSGQLPGEPAKITGDRQLRIVTWMLSVIFAFLSGLGVVQGWRRLRQHHYTTPPHATGRWISVERDAAGFRRRARFRRIGTLLLVPQVVLIGVNLPAAIRSGVTIEVAGAMFANLLITIPAVIMLIRSRSASTDADWRLQRAGTLPWRRRIGTAMLSATALTALAVAVLLFAAGAGADHLFVLPAQIAEGSMALLLFVAAPVTWRLARRLHRRQVTDAWIVLGRRPGTPILYVRLPGSENLRIRASRLLKRGPVDTFFELFAGQRRTGFEEMFMTVLAGHGPVRSIEPEQPRLPALGPPVTRVAADAGRGVLDGSVRAARFVVVSGATAMRPGDALATLQAVGSGTADKPLMVVLPPAAPQEIQRLLSEWRAALSPTAPFGELNQLPLADGVHVMLHLPGRGWHAWGASIRDQWTYRRALHDAVAFTSAQAEYDNRPDGDTATPADAARPTITVLVTAGDRDAGSDIAAGLDSLGVTARVATAPGASGPGEDRATVVVLSPESIRDEAWLAGVNDLESGGRQPVPVQIGTVDAALVPAHLAAINWIPWPGPDRLRSLADVFAAVNADPSRYQLHRDLLNQARTWATHGRQPAMLITDYERAEQAARHVGLAIADGVARPNPLQHEFTQTSLNAARRRRSRRRVSTITITAVVAVTTVVASFAVVSLRSLGNTNRLTGLLSSVPIIAPDRPDWAALLAGAVVMQGGEFEADIGRRALRTLLNTTWREAFLGPGHDALIADMVPLADGRILTVDALGSVTAWNPEGGHVLWRYRVADTTTSIDATPDGSRLAVGGDQRVTVVATDPWRAVTVDVPSPVERVAISRDGRTVAVATEKHELLTIDAASGKVRRVGAYGALLDVRRTTGPDGLGALAADGAEEVTVVDVTTGRPVRSWKLAVPSSDPAGALGADGRTVAVVRADRQLMTGATRLTATGQTVADGYPSLVLLPGGRVYVSSAQEGVRAVDTRAGITTARLGTEAGIRHLRAADDGRTVLTTSGLGVAVWHTRGLTSVSSDGEAIRTRPRTGGPAVRPDPDTAGSVLVSASGGAGERRLLVVGGTVVTTAVSDDGRNAIVGSDRGEVAEIDLAHDLVVRRWTAPTSAPVQELGWVGTPGWLAVRTADGLWWNVRACDGCGADENLLADLRQRLRGCYREDNLQNVERDARTRLGVRVCSPSPAPVKG
ncbi:PQQ-binding-like beta-propeller repeat protein [Micromonospora sp. NPDC047187]|uniref:WD40 repeat domain-containing protein n=1 Tax=Micromonospora sp. NPDC047187 TaxID=3155262 RepID=UPI0033CEC4FA